MEESMEKFVQNVLEQNPDFDTLTKGKLRKLYVKEKGVTLNKEQRGLFSSVVDRLLREFTAGVMGKENNPKKLSDGVSNLDLDGSEKSPSHGNECDFQSVENTELDCKSAAAPSSNSDAFQKDVSESNKVHHSSDENVATVERRMPKRKARENFSTSDEDSCGNSVKSTTHNGPTISEKDNEPIEADLESDDEQFNLNQSSCGSIKPQNKKQRKALLHYSSSDDEPILPNSKSKPKEMIKKSSSEEMCASSSEGEAKRESDTNTDNSDNELGKSSSRKTKSRNSISEEKHNQNGNEEKARKGSKLSPIDKKQEKILLDSSSSDDESISPATKAKQREKVRDPSAEKVDLSSSDDDDDEVAKDTEDETSSNGSSDNSESERVARSTSQKKKSKNGTNFDSSTKENHSKNGNTGKTSKTNKSSTTNKKTLSDPKLDRLKKYISVAGIHVQSYNKLWESSKSTKAKANKLLQVLQNAGLKGTPSIEKCKKLKKKIERKKEIQELDLSNIIKTEGRPKRNVRSLYRNDEGRECPPKKFSSVRRDSNESDPEPMSRFSRIKDIFDSEGSD